jgi:hypothetical protein
MEFQPPTALAGRKRMSSTTGFQDTHYGTLNFRLQPILLKNPKSRGSQVSANAHSFQVRFNSFV